MHMQRTMKYSIQLTGKIKDSLKISTSEKLQNKNKNSNKTLHTVS